MQSRVFENKHNCCIYSRSFESMPNFLNFLLFLFYRTKESRLDWLRSFCRNDLKWQKTKLKMILVLTENFQVKLEVKNKYVSQIYVWPPTVKSKQNFFPQTNVNCLLLPYPSFCLFNLLFVVTSVFIWHLSSP